ncbi:MAG TPA: ferrous iron transport protein A [Terriglobales bacterium]|nr:ferrous iron transport protein A [Terriglobales bacterium]
MEPDVKPETIRTGKIGRSDDATSETKRLPLSSAARGRSFVVTDIPQGRPRAQLIRLGIMEGELIKCVERLPGGTVVVEKNRQEIAIGSSLATSILVDFEVGD